MLNKNIFFLLCIYKLFQICFQWYFSCSKNCPQPFFLQQYFYLLHQNFWAAPDQLHRLVSPAAKRRAVCLRAGTTTSSSGLGPQVLLSPGDWPRWTTVTIGWWTSMSCMLAVEDTRWYFRPYSFGPIVIWYESNLVRNKYFTNKRLSRHYRHFKQHPNWPFGFSAANFGRST